MRIHDILAAKPQHDVVTVSPASTVRELVDLLAQHNVGALVVSSDGQAVEGIVSERDVVRHLQRNAEVLESVVSEIMTAAVHTAVRDDKLDDLMSLMTEQRVRHIPVIEDDVLVGIVSIGDVVKHKIQALELERDQLDSYISQS
jgi:CBS domain-containing protein